MTSNEYKVDKDMIAHGIDMVRRRIEEMKGGGAK